MTADRTGATARPAGAGTVVVVGGGEGAVVVVGAIVAGGRVVVVALPVVVGWAALHAESDTGQVPYRQWPAAVKGHFVTRHPPLPDE